MKEKQKKIYLESGITLVALIITIIVLVILAAVSVAAVYNSKIVNYAVNGSIDYTQAAVNENEILKGSVDIIESGISKIQEIVGDSGNSNPVTPPEPSKPPTVDELAIGAYVSYVPKAAEKYDIPRNRIADGATDQSGHPIPENQEFHSHVSTDITKPNTDWRIWDKADSTHVRLISTTASTDTILLQGANGYNNAVGILNEACSTVYSNSDYATAKSIDMDDYDKVSTFNKSSWTDGDGFKYGQTKNDFGRAYSLWPDIHQYERNGTVNRNWQGTSKSELTWYSGNEYGGFVATYTYYCQTLADNLPNTPDKPYYALISQQKGNTGEGNPSAYWVASRCVNFNHTYADFYVFVVTGNTGTYTLFRSNGNTFYCTSAVRPIVTLDLTKCAIGTDTTTDGTMEHPYNIVKK